MFLAFLTLITGLAISAIAIYYSVLGLAAIFAAAPIPIYIMGTILEISKLVTASWLKQNWQRAPSTIKIYLTISVVVLMLITSMGIFGFLSKAHSDQSLVSGDAQSKIAIFDEKIKTERENIDAARKALAQMDAQVNERLSRSSDDKGAERAVQIRRQQQAERVKLQKDITTSQANISRLNEERAPIAAELRKVEAEVGPIKYIAKFIYGENTDTNLLEKAVTWVIIIIVLVFDPLAVLLLLASQMSFQWLREDKEKLSQEMRDEYDFSNGKRGLVLTPVEEPEKTEEPQDTEPVQSPWPFPVREKEDEDKVTPETHPYLFKPWVWKVPGVEPVGPMVYRPENDLPKEEATPVDETKEENTTQEEAPFSTIELDPIAQEIVDDSNESDSIDLIEAKRLWKEHHPEDSLKNQRKLLELGIIKELPWEKEPYLKKKNLTYLEKDGKNQIKKEISED